MKFLSKTESKDEITITLEYSWLFGLIKSERRFVAIAAISSICWQWMEVDFDGDDLGLIIGKLSIQLDDWCNQN